MGALTLDINILHSSLGASNFIEIDERRSYHIRLDRTFKNKRSRILLLTIGFLTRSVF